MKAGFWEILLVVILILILFGHYKIPEVMKNLAAGIKVFKKEINTNGKSIILIIKCLKLFKQQESSNHYFFSTI